MKKITSITDVTSDLNNDGLSVNVEVNRQLAARYGITPATIDNALYDALGQRIVSTIFDQSSQYRVILVAKPESLPICSRSATCTCPARPAAAARCR
jgi:multidrug efflux pump